MPEYTPNSEDAGKYVVDHLMVPRGVHAKTRDDAANGAVCGTCGCWYPASYMVEVDGRLYCREDAPDPDPFLRDIDF